jgi:autotransporter translocation and assembly factor TamB
MRASVWGRVRKWLIIAAIFIACGAIALSFEPVRAAAVRAFVAAYLSLHGFDLQTADVFVSGGRIDFDNVIVTEGPSQPFFLGKAIDVAYLLNGLHVSSVSLTLEQPYVVLRREKDGTFNAQRLLARGAQAAMPSSPALQAVELKITPPAERLRVDVRDGAIDLENRYTPARAGRHFSIERLNVHLRFSPGGVSRGSLDGVIVSASHAAPVHGAFFEDDHARFAAVQAVAANVAIAPVLDLLISSPTFILQRGSASAQLTGYALQWPAGGSQVWHLMGRGRFRDGRMSIAPLSAAARDVSGPLTFNDGVLFLPRVTAVAAQLPVTAYGSISIMPSVTLNVIVRTAGSLERARNLFAFTKAMPVRGHLCVLARIDGSPTDPRVDVEALLPQGARYGRTALTSASASFEYFRNHLTFPAITARYQGFAVYGNGDVDVPGAGPLGNGNESGTGANGPPTGRFILSLEGPSGAIPWLANLDHRGTLSARAWLQGAITALDGSGFLRLQGSKASARTSFAATSAALTVGPLIATDPHGGSVWLGATVNRKNERDVHADVVADHYRLALDDRKVELPGIFDRPFGTPQISARINGGATVSGQLHSPQFAMKLSLHRLVAGNAPLGDVALAATGEDGLAALQLTASHARFADVPFTNARVLLGVSQNRLHIYGATADAAGGRLEIMGDVPISSGARDERRSLFLAAQHIQLADLQHLHVPASAGAVSLIGVVGGTARRPQASGAAILAGGEIAGRPVSGDAQIDYNGSRAMLESSRVLLGNGSAVTARGVVRNVSLNRPPSGASVDLTAAASVADISDLTGAALSASFPVRGTLDANVRIRGDLSSPVISGTVYSPAGTLRGVTYENLQGGFSFARGAMALSGGHVVIGSSPINLAGSLAPGAARVSLSSPHMDLSDLNDFYQGKDMFEGTGSFRLALGTQGAQPIAAGSLHFRDAAFASIPLDNLRGRLATNNNAIIAELEQSGVLGHSHIQASATLPQSGSAPEKLAHAYFRVRAKSSNVNVAMLGPALPSFAAGASGQLNIVASATGPARNLAAGASFELTNGYFHKEPIETLTGSLAMSRSGLRLRSFRLGVGGVNVSARGTYKRNGVVAASALLSAPDVATFVHLARINVPLSGSLALAVNASGTVRAPRVHAVLTANRGNAYGIPYDRITLDSTYAPGGITVRSASVEFAKRGGTIVAAGTAPVPYGPKPAPLAHGRVDPPPLDIRLQTSGLDLAVLNPLLGKRGSLAGVLGFDARATGSIRRPRLAGSAALRNASIKTQLETVPITGLNGHLSFNNDRIDLRNLSGTMGKGTIALAATARLVPSRRRTGGPGRLAYAAQLRATNADVSVPKFFSGVINANLGLRSGPPQSYLAGNVTISDASIPFAGILALAGGTTGGLPQSKIIPGVPPLRPGHSISYAGSIYGPNPNLITWTPKPAPERPSIASAAAAPVALDLTATAADNVQTTGLVSVTGAGTLHIGGTSAAPVIEGPIDLIRGQFGLFDTTFDLERGHVAFHPRDGFLPTVNVVAAAYRPEAEVTVTVTGRVDQLHTGIESDPPMSQNQILASILHINDINDALSGGGTQSVNAGAAAGGLLASTLSSPLLSALNYGLEQTLNIQEVNFALASNGSPALELRKQWGHNLYAMYRQTFASPPTQIYGLSYVVRNNFELDFEQAQNPPGAVGQTGLEPIWQTTIAATAHFNLAAHRKFPKRRR